MSLMAPVEKLIIYDRRSYIEKLLPVCFQYFPLFFIDKFNYNVTQIFLGLSFGGSFLASWISKFLTNFGSFSF